MKQYTVIITEKPDAMNKIAQSLADDKPKKIEKGGFHWFELKRGKENLIVTCAVGHLFVLDTVKKKGGWTYPVFDVHWIPSHVKKGHEFSKKYFEVLAEAVKKGKNFIVATDYDTEGAVIGFNVLKMLANKEDAKRMKFSVDGEEDLLIYNDSHTKLVKIGDFVDRCLEENSKGSMKIDDYEVADISHLGMKTLSLNTNTFATEEKLITKAIRHKLGEEKIKEITLESGRKIRVTDGHSLFVFRNRKIFSVPSNELKKDDYIVAPLTLPVKNKIKEMATNVKPTKRSGMWHLPQKLKVTRELARLFGYYISKGHCARRHMCLSFGHHEKKLVKDASYCIKKIFGRKPIIRKEKTCINVIFGGQAAINFFDKELKIGRLSYEKSIPQIIFNIDESLQLEFVKALLEGDGRVSGYGIMLNTSSKRLQSQFLYLLLQLGIYAGAVTTTLHKGPDNKRRKQKVYRVYVQNKEELEKLSTILPSWVKKCSIYRSRRKKTLRENVKEVYTAIPMEPLALNFSNRKDKIGRQSLERELSKLDPKTREVCNKIINSNLVFLRVKSIREVKSTNGYVYDVSVENNENFVCGLGGVFAHNSTMTKDELIESFEKANKHLDFGQVEAGLTRHFLDFYWGINLTRALTLALKNAAEKGFTILSTGRVQGPTLAMLFEKEQEIKKFKPTPFWQLELHIKLDGKEIIANYIEEKIWKKDVAEKVLESSKGKDAIVENIKKREYKQSPPVPFNTTDLQAEAYAQFKYSPTQTLSIAESLYQAGYISYPRSSSQKLPANIGYEKILKALAKLKSYEKFVQELLQKKLKPKEGAREDPAHPAVYPTFEIADLKKLTAQQKKLYDLIIRRFLSVFAEEALRESNTVTLDVNGNKFVIVGKRTLNPGWTKIYEPYMSTEELILPELKVGDKVKVLKLEMLDKETQPPGRFSQGSILKEMEKRNLGTRATRAEILKTLYDRRYIIGQSIKVTKLGEVVTEALKENSPRILSEEMTRKFEEEIDLVMNGKKEREKVLEEAKKVLVEILKDFKKSEKKIGKKLLEGLQQARKEERHLGNCPICKTGEMRIIYSRKTRKRFAGCSNYPKCKTGFPLPQFGMIVPLGKLCDKCQHPMIQVNRKGARPYRMCINHKCVTKESWGKNKKPSEKVVARVGVKPK